MSACQPLRAKQFGDTSVVLSVEKYYNYFEKMQICLTSDKISGTLVRSCIVNRRNYVRQKYGQHLMFCWPCIIMYLNNVTNLIHYDDDKSGIYKIKCNTCHRAYIGQIKRILKLRYQEHVRYIRNNNPNRLTHCISSTIDTNMAQCTT
jgi:hypothetical protein